MHKPALSRAVSILMILAAGCAPSLKSQYADVARVVSSRTGQTLDWSPEMPADSFVIDAARPLLRRPLSVDDAVWIALVNNRTMQAALGEVGISRAELVDAGLLANPQIFGRYREPTTRPKTEEYELRLTQNVIDILTMPLRRDVAKGQLDSTKAEVAVEAIDLASKTQTVFYDLQSKTLALDAAREQGDGSKIARLQLDIIAGREELNRLLGISGVLATTWTIDPTFDEPPPLDPPCDHFEEVAVANRLELAALRSDVAKIEDTLRLQQIMRWLPVLNAGVDYEKKSEVLRVIGPVITVEVPIFDWGQGRIAKTRAMLNQTRFRVAAKEIDIRSEVREACARLKAARAALESDPDDEEALHDYWVARAGVGKALGDPGRGRR